MAALQVGRMSQVLEKAPMGIVRRWHVVDDNARIVLTEKTREIKGAAPKAIDVRRDDDESRLFECHTEQLDQVIVGVEDGDDCRRLPVSHDEFSPASFMPVGEAAPLGFQVEIAARP